MMQSGYNIYDLVQEAQTRWLKPAEVLFILQNYNEDQLTHEPPQKPASGSLFLFNKRVLRFFRRDGHSWRRKKDGRSVGEAHERLKVGNVEALNCYYAHGEQNPNFQRRSYWMLDLAYEHIVLVHYRDITELQGRNSSGSFSKLLRLSPSALSQSPSSYAAQHPGSTAVISELNEPCQSLSSPGSVEGSSDVAIKSNMMNRSDSIERTGEISSSSELDILALQMLEELLSLNDDNLEEIKPLFGDNENSNSSQNIVDGHGYGGSAEMQAESNNLGLQGDTGDNGKRRHQSLDHEFAVESEESFFWKEMLEFNKSLPDVESQEENIYTSDGNGMLLPTSKRGPVEEHDDCHALNFGGSNAISSLPLLPIEIENLKFPVYSPAMDIHDTNPDYYTTLFEEGHPGMPLEANSSLTIAQEQKFTIREISPEWGDASEATKVLIIGSFLCDPSEFEWNCMFGDSEVPLLIVQEGVICCQAPPHLPGKVTLCITSGNRESCSEVREFEYRVKPASSANCSSSQTEEAKTREELLLLVRFVHMLLSETLIQKVDNSGPGIDQLIKCKASEDSWSRVIDTLFIDTLLVDTWTSCGTTDWLLQELLKDKLQQWLSSRSNEGHEQPCCSWSKNEQGIIHMVAGLGFEWALSAILCSGVGINFRDISGWTALHWAARFGREKMVAELIACGASAGALTDPTSKDPMGQTAASIAATSGYKGLAGYLSEVALTNHLSSLTLEESELSKNSADVEAETTVNNISMRSLETSEDDRLSLKDTLAAVRNAAQAAARIQSAFRAHSFKKRKQKEAAAAAAAAAGADKYDILSNDVQGLSAASKLAFRNVHDYNSAALCIQKKYRGWKGRKNFLAFRQQVVTIQAHVRGHQVRIYYKVICWAVSVLEKVVLRWHRGGVGLRGYRPKSESIDENEDEDIHKLFRKQKVDVAVEEAVSRVISMVQCPDARQQYRRMLERYRLAKAELGVGVAEGLPSTSQTDVSSMDNDNT